MKKSKKNISILINSVLGKSSIPQLNDFIRFARTLNPDLHSLEVVRDEKIQPYNGNFHGNDTALNTETIFQTMNSDDFDAVKQARLLIDELYRKEDILYGLYKLRSNMMTDLQRDTLLYDKKWPAACMAGRTGFAHLFHAFDQKPKAQSVTITVHILKITSFHLRTPIVYEATVGC